MTEYKETNQQNIKIIEQFISGALSPEAVSELNKRLENEALLQQQVREYEVLIHGIEKQS